MPWEISVHTESSDFTVQLAQKQVQEQRESLPGLMIFRKASTDISNDAGSILFVFVVGETPTGGLHLEQFQNALNIRKSILAGTPKDLEEASVLRIFGPAFSGSLASLNAMLNTQEHAQFSTILIRSGSVSSDRAMRDFCESIRTEWQIPTSSNGKDGSSEGDSDPCLEAKGRPDFATFQLSDAYQELYLSQFLERGGRENAHSRVAILSEDETAFGSQELLKYPKSPSPGLHFVRLYFPREIAQLRDAYQREVNSQPALNSSNSPPQIGLPLSLTVTGNDDDSVAPYSPQTPLSQESIMQAIVSTLSKQHVRLVVIRATDPLDMIFLCRYLRQNYPQGRLVTVGADTLMMHDFADPRFHGILALTTYPLLAGTDFPFFKRTSGDDEVRVHRLFSDGRSVGEYNAFLSLLAPGARCESKCETKTLPPADYKQFGLPSFLQQKSTPSHGNDRAYLWLMAVGKEGYWPVTVLDDESPSDVPIGAKDRPRPNVRAVDVSPQPPHPYSVHFFLGWTIFWLCTIGFTLSLAWVLAFPPIFSRSEILARFGGEPSRPSNALLFSISMLSLACQTVFVFPAIVWLGHFGFRGSPHWWRSSFEGLALICVVPLGLAYCIGFRKRRSLALAYSGAFVGGLTFVSIKWQPVRWLIELFEGLPLLMFCYLISVVLLGLACYQGYRKRESSVLAYVGASLCAVIFVLSIALAWYFRSHELSNRLGAFVYRYINVGAGVSPCLPLFFLLAGWLWWCWQALTGVASTQEKYMVLPCEKAFSEATVPGAAARVRLKAIATDFNEEPCVNQGPWRMLGALPLAQRILISTFGGLGIVLLLMRPSEIAEAFESRPYKWMYWILLYSCLFLLCYLLSHIIGLWLEFRTFLRAIDRVPFRRGFTDLKNMTWKPLWKLAGSGRQQFLQLLGGEMEGLTQIQNGSWLSAGLAKAIDSAKDATNMLSADFERLKDKIPGATPVKVRQLFHDLQKRLATVTAEALIYANQDWNKETYVPPATASDGKAPVEPPAKDLTLRAIERFLCLFYVNVILVPLRRLQTLILAMAGVFVFVLISYSSYPFESRESFHVLLISIFFVISLVVGIVYGQMYTDPLLSRITNTKPGELGLDFWVRLGTFVFIPLLSLISVQFPEVNSFLFSWLQPALQSLK
jgi:hypothetical protein